MMCEASQPSDTDSPKMCEFNELIFTCGHSTYPLKAYCHRARNDFYHECHYVKKLRAVYLETWRCKKCRTEEENDAMHAEFREGGAKASEASAVMEAEKAQQAKQPSGQDPAQAPAPAPAETTEQADVEMRD